MIHWVCVLSVKWCLSISLSFFARSATLRIDTTAWCSDYCLNTCNDCTNSSGLIWLNWSDNAIHLRLIFNLSFDNLYICWTKTAGLMCIWLLQQCSTLQEGRGFNASSQRFAYRRSLWFTRNSQNLKKRIT